MLALCIAACVVAVLSLLGNLFMLWQLGQHFQHWSAVTDNIVEQTQDVVSNHNHRIGYLELAHGATYSPVFGYQKAKKA